MASSDLAVALPVSERSGMNITKAEVVDPETLEEKQAISAKRTRGRMIGFVLALLVVWMLAVVCMRHLFSICAFGVYLDNVMISVLVFVASYSIPLDLEQEDIPDDVPVVEMSDRQPLLAKESSSYTSSPVTTL